MHDNTEGFNNTAIGASAGANQTTGSNNVYIGAGMSGVAGENGACYIASIFSQTSAGGLPVLINAFGKLVRPLPQSDLRRTSNRWTKPAKRYSHLNR